MYGKVKYYKNKATASERLLRRVSHVKTLSMSIAKKVIPA